jgi:peptide deformylase
MTVVPIRELGDPVLRESAKLVTDFDGELRRLVGDLRETLRDSGGAGLAAPQLGVGFRVFVWSPNCPTVVWTTWSIPFWTSRTRRNRTA